jgi:N-acetyl-D-muramate 6-phosphate phosphatase
VTGSTGSPIAALLLDLDGTLVDTAPDLAAALDAVMIAQGREPLPYPSVRRHVSDGARGLIRLAFPSAEADAFETLKDELLREYAGRVAVHSHVFDGMRAVLEVCQRSGLPWGVVTNKPARFTEPLMQALDLADAAACTISGDTADRAKPHPDPLLLAASELSLAPAHCLYVGDAERDVESARAAGMPSAVAAWGYIHADEDPHAWGADTVIDGPTEILGLLGLLGPNP